MKINTAKHDFFDINKKINSFIAGAYAQDYIELDFKILVIKFKDYYKMNSHSKQLFSFQTSFAASLQRQIQSSQKEKFISKSSSNHINELSKDHNQEDNECSSSCDQHSL